MRVLVIYAHPLPDSLASALHRVIIELAAQSTRMEYRGADTSSAA
jgi:putative NADPH-quinone reductase